MKQAIYTCIILIVCCIAVSGKISKPTTPTASLPDALTSATDLTADSDTLPTDKTATNDLFADDNINIEAIKNLVQQWNLCHNTHRTDDLSQLYASVCLYYGTDQTRDFVRSNKEKFFSKHSQYQQQIRDLEINILNGATIDVTFTKYVRVSTNDKWQPYEAYLRLIGGEDEWFISWESDKTTDQNLEQRRQNKPTATVNVDNTTPLEQIFNDKNVGKEVCTDYWSLVGFEDDAVEGPLAKAIMDCNTIGARNSVCGTIRKGYNGNRNTYYCGGTCSGGEYTARVLWIYNAQTRTLSVYPEF